MESEEYRMCASSVRSWMVMNVVSIVASCSGWLAFLTVDSSDRVLPQPLESDVCRI